MKRLQVAWIAWIAAAGTAIIPDDWPAYLDFLDGHFKPDTREKTDKERA
jgi:hypothetical protein